MRRTTEGKAGAWVTDIPLNPRAHITKSGDYLRVTIPRAEFLESHVQPNEADALFLTRLHLLDIRDSVEAVLSEVGQAYDKKRPGSKEAS